MATPAVKGCELPVLSSGFCVRITCSFPWNMHSTVRHWQGRLLTCRCLKVNGLVSCASLIVAARPTWSENTFQKMRTIPSSIVQEGTTEAIQAGAYGTPSIVVRACQPEEQADLPKSWSTEPQLFFGSDRFEQLAFMFKKAWYGPCPSRSKL